MLSRAASPEAVKLLHEGTLALARVESNGVRIDTDYLDRTIAEVDRKAAELQKRLESDDIFKLWKDKYKHKEKIGSRVQLADVLFNELKVPYTTERTATGQHRTDGELLSKIDLPFVKDYLKWWNLRKDRSTFLEGLRREVVDGFFHPDFNLHLASTFRSSSGGDREDSRSGHSLNFQNLPIRDPERGKMIRQAFIPREGQYIVEVDFSGIEVRISCAYHKDPTLIKYVEDPTTDMHRDTASDLFLFPVEYLVKYKDWTKKTVRDWSKNRFVFPEFYGSVYFQCAPNLWEGVCLNIKLPDSDQTIADHLAKHGIRELGSCFPNGTPKSGTFVKKVKEIEDSFWQYRFPVYNQWKKSNYNAFLRQGGLKTLTGFWVGAIGKNGLMSRNDVNNTGIQGSSFHCLLWSLTRIVEYIKKHKWETKVFGQIHDSLVMDVPQNELDDVLVLCKDVMIKKLPEAWKWINVPLEIEAEVAPIGRSWYEKKAIKIP